MKLTLVLMFAFVVVAIATPLDKKTKNESFGKCLNICQDDVSKPICASDGDKLTLSFNNECALKKYNCEHNKILTKKSDKECPGSGGVRLS